jgi:hypothetical protein
LDLPLFYRLKVITIIGVLLGTIGGASLISPMPTQRPKQIASAFAGIEESMGALLASPADAVFNAEHRREAVARLVSFRYLAGRIAPMHCDAAAALAAETFEVPESGNVAFQAAAADFIARGREAVEACRGGAQ